MKNLYTCLLYLVLFYTAPGLHAQPWPVREPDYNKPLLFQQLPQRIPVNTASLDDLLTNERGNEISLQVSPGVVWSGTVSSTGKEDPRVQSIMIKTTIPGNAGLFISRIRRPDGTQYYKGRIIGKNYGDAYEIIYEKGVYYFEKKGFYDLLNE